MADAPHSAPAYSARARKTYIRQCKLCGKDYSSPQSKSSLCSRACHAALSRATMTATMERLFPKPVCPQCGLRFQRCSVSSAQHARGYVQTYCSRACRSAALSLLRQQRRESAVATKAQDVEALRAARAAAKEASIRRSCPNCNFPFRAVPANRRFCSEVCSRAKNRRDIHARDRARRRSYADSERVDWLKVFERDGWLCHLCGRKTLKAKRGTNHDRAPELDHIVPLAKRGPHTNANTACACRKCNRAKRDTIDGQPSLLAALAC